MVAEGELETEGAWKWIAPPPPPPTAKKFPEVEVMDPLATTCWENDTPCTELAALAVIVAPAAITILVEDCSTKVPAVGEGGMRLIIVFQFSVGAVP
jgi:hypothetical protein